MNEMEATFVITSPSPTSLPNLISNSHSQNQRRSIDREPRPGNHLIQQNDTMLGMGLIPVFLYRKQWEASHARLEYTNTPAMALQSQGTPEWAFD